MWSSCLVCGLLHLRSMSWRVRVGEGTGEVTVHHEIDESFALHTDYGPGRVTDYGEETDI